MLAQEPDRCVQERTEEGFSEIKLNREKYEKDIEKRKEKTQID